MGPEFFQSKIVSLVGPRQVQCHSAQVRSKTAYTRPSGAQNFTHAHHRSRCHSAHVRSKTVYTRPSEAQNFTHAHLGPKILHKALDVSWFSKFQKNFYTDFVLNVFSVPRWVFLASGIKMTLKVPGTILARFENSDPLCGPTMENARIFNTHHGSKRPIMDPINHIFFAFID